MQMLPVVLLAVALCAPRAIAASEPLEATAIPAAPMAEPPEEFALPPLTLEVALVDATAVALGVLATQLQPPGTLPARKLARGVATAAGVGAVVAPTVYFANRQTTRGFASLALRVTLPMAFASFASLGCALSLFDMSCVRPTMLVGATVGLGAAIVADLAGVSRAITQQYDRSEKWYGYQLLVLDAASLATGLLIAGLATDKDVPLLRRSGETEVITLPLATGLVWWMLSVGAPVIHWANGQLGPGFVSVLMRSLGAPLVATVGMVGYCAATAGEEACGGVGLSWGLLGGVASVAMIDAFINGYKKPRRSDRSPAVANVPILVPIVLDGGAGLGIAHRF